MKNRSAFRLLPLLFLLVVFVDAIRIKISLFEMWDEITLLVVLICFLVLIFEKRRIRKSVLQEILIFGIFIAIGIIGTILHPELQPVAVAKLKDFVAISKFPLLMILLPAIHTKPIKKSEWSQIVSISKILIIIALIASIATYGINGLFYTGEVRFTKVFKFVFSHPTYLVTAYTILQAVLVADSIKKNRYYILANCIILFLSQRTKAYAIVALSLIIVLAGENRIKKVYGWLIREHKINKGRTAAVIIAVFAILWLVIRSKVLYIFKWGLTAARPALYIVGAEIMFRYFPFGSGLGTFGSYLSGAYYSPLYYKYGISAVLGLRPNEYNYMADVFWPCIYAEFGVFGLLLYLRLIIKQLSNNIRLSKSADHAMGIIILWVYILLASGGEAVFTNIMGVQIALTLYLFLDAQYYSNTMRSK